MNYSQASKKLILDFYKYFVANKEYNMGLFNCLDVICKDNPFNDDEIEELYSIFNLGKNIEEDGVAQNGWTDKTVNFLINAYSYFSEHGKTTLLYDQFIELISKKNVLSDKAINILQEIFKKNVF